MYGKRWAIERASAALDVSRLPSPVIRVSALLCAVPFGAERGVDAGDRAAGPAPARHTAGRLPRSLLASTMSRLDSSVRKKGHSACMRRSSAVRCRRSAGCPQAARRRRSRSRTSRAAPRDTGPRRSSTGSRADPRWRDWPCGPPGAIRCSVRRSRGSVWLRRSSLTKTRVSYTSWRYALWLACDSSSASARNDAGGERVVCKSVASSVAATSVSRLRRPISGFAYLDAMTSPCSGEPDLAVHGAGRLRQDGLVTRAAAAAHRARRGRGTAAGVMPAPQSFGPNSFTSDVRRGTAPSCCRRSRRPCCCHCSRA